MNLKGLTYFITALLLGLLFTSCATGGPPVQEDWNEEMFFKSAQDAFDEDQLDQALYYYDVYLLRYPTNRTKGIAAEYEIAYIHYKWGDYDRAEQLFTILLDRYESDPYAYLYPAAYRVLSEIVMEKIVKLQEIEELPFFRRTAARRQFYGTGRDETVEETSDLPSEQ